MRWLILIMLAGCCSQQPQPAKDSRLVELEQEWDRIKLEAQVTEGRKNLLRLCKSTTRYTQPSDWDVCYERAGLKR